MNIKVATLCLLLVLTLSGCFDNYESVVVVGSNGKGKGGLIERVLLKRPYAVFLRNEGVEVAGPLGIGQWNHGKGPTAAYDVDMAIQNTSIKTNIKTADNINVTFYPKMTWQVRKGASIDLCLNYLFGSWMPELETGNKVQIISVPIGKIFDLNILRAFDQASRDIVDEYRSKNISPDILGQEIMTETIRLLEQRRIPRTVLRKGKIQFDPKQTIGILDIIDIQGVTIPGYTNPTVVADSITAIEVKKAEVSEAKSTLESWKTKAEMRLTKAHKAKTVAINMKKMLAENPQMMNLEKLEILRSVLEDANEEGAPVTTKVMIIPESMLKQVRFPVTTSWGDKQRAVAPTTTQ